MTMIWAKNICKALFGYSLITSAAVLGLFATNCLPALSQSKNTVTFENQSAKGALVKLIGPTPLAVEVPGGQTETVTVAAGEYYILVRYGSDSGEYEYSRGDRFSVTETANTRSALTITLHTVEGGNYRTRQGSQEEFEGAESGRKPAVGFDRTQQLEAKESESVEDILETYDQIMERFYRNVDWQEQEAASIDALADEFNKWVMEGNEQIEAERSRIQRQGESLSELSARIKELESERNALVKEHNELVKGYELGVQSLRHAAAQSAGEAKTQQAEIESARQEFQAKLRDYKVWVESNRDLDFFKKLNRLYADLAEATEPTGSKPMPDDYLIRVRGMRHRLGSHARTTQQELKNGFIVVKATLDDREECSLIVDTGATYVTIPPALVRALGLSDQVGEPVELVLAGGIQTTAREVLLPRISVHGREARDVQAVILDEPGLGIDGLLGQSFLNRFTYRLDKDRDPALILESDRTDTDRQETSK